MTSLDIIKIHQNFSELSFVLSLKSQWHWKLRTSLCLTLICEIIPSTITSWWPTGLFDTNDKHLHLDVQCTCYITMSLMSFSSVQSLSRAWLFATPWITARQASLSISSSRSSLRLTSIESVMPSSHLILGRQLLLLSPIPPSIRVFSNESTLPMR